VLISPDIGKWHIESHYPTQAQKRGLTRISCTLHPATTACAAFIEESRMKFINANTLHRKSGEWGTQHLLPLRQNIYDAPAAGSHADPKAPEVRADSQPSPSRLSFVGGVLTQTLKPVPFKAQRYKVVPVAMEVAGEDRRHALE
jgi:hypothetical protein